MARTKRTPTPDQSTLAMMSLDNDISTGSQKLRPEDMLSRDRPATPADAFKRARRWGQENLYVEQVNLLKLGFYNHGMRFVPVDPKDHDKLKKFLKDSPQVARDMRRHVREVWQEWLLIDTVVSFWREQTGAAPFLFKADICKYSDRMGIKILKVKLDRADTVPTKDQSAGAVSLEHDAMVERYFKGKEITMDVTTEEKWDEHFEVQTRGLRGDGFVLPRLYTAFRTCSQNESMEVGESMLAYAGRRIVHRFKLGFEAKGNSPASNFQKEFSMWTKARSDAILGFFQGRSGFMDVVENFDQEMAVFLGDGGPKNYDARRWGTIVQRMIWWAGPLGFMMVANSMNPFLLPMLRTAAEADREEVGDHLNYVLNRGFKLPCPVRVRWSNRCFIDSRLAWDMANALMKQGPLSLTTALKEGDFDPVTEARHKEEEAKPANAKIYLPVHNPTQSKNAPDGGKAGRPNERGAAEGAKKSGQTSGKKK